MHVAIVGAGALGRVYGARLTIAGAAVTFVVRASRAGGHEPVRLVRIDGDHAEHAIEQPRLATSVPPESDIVIVCVRAEQIDTDLEALLQPSSVPIVMMTPLMPDVYAGLRSSLGPRVLAAMPGVVAYVTTSGATRYWMPRVAPTLIDEPRPANLPVSELVRLLIASGMPVRLELGVSEANPATTVAFIPLAMGLDAAGSIDALLRDRPLLALAIAAAREGLALSGRIGKRATWASFLTRFAGPRTLRLGVALGRRQSPEAVQYVEEHFGRKLHAQNVAMAEAMVRLAVEKDTKHEAIQTLLERLRAHGPMK
jgi:ketopantoate reductase